MEWYSFFFVFFVFEKFDFDLKSHIFLAISLAMSMLKSSTERNERKDTSNVATGGNIIIITDSLSDTKYPNLNQVKEQVRNFFIKIG